MKGMSWRLALLTGLSLAASATAGRAQDKATFTPQELQAKISYCKTCHGLSGEGHRGAFPMPRLAGQQPEYLEAQLKAFIERRRENNIMRNVAHVLSPSMLTALSSHFKDLNPKPVDKPVSGEVVAAGKKIFDDGVPSADVPACSLCHGPEAKGQGVFPRLAGQLHDYMFNKLTNWTKERGQDPKKPDDSAMMAPVVHGLTAPQVTAVATYLSTLE